MSVAVIGRGSERGLGARASRRAARPAGSTEAAAGLRIVEMCGPDRLIKLECPNWGNPAAQAPA